MLYARPRKFTSYPLFTWELLEKMCSSKMKKQIKKEEVIRSREWCVQFRGEWKRRKTPANYQSQKTISLY